MFHVGTSKKKQINIFLIKTKTTALTFFKNLIGIAGIGITYSCYTKTYYLLLISYYLYTYFPFFFFFLLVSNYKKITGIFIFLRNFEFQPPPLVATVSNCLPVRRCLKKYGISALQNLKCFISNIWLTFIRNRKDSIPT